MIQNMTDSGQDNIASCTSRILEPSWTMSVKNLQVYCLFWCSLMALNSTLHIVQYSLIRWPWISHISRLKMRGTVRIEISRWWRYGDKTESDFCSVTSKPLTLRKQSFFLQALAGLCAERVQPLLGCSLFAWWPNFCHYNTLCWNALFVFYFVYDYTFLCLAWLSCVRLFSNMMIVAWYFLLHLSKFSQLAQ